MNAVGQRPAVLAINGLTKRFGGLLAVDDVSISIGDRTIHSIIGPNGAGKTTLFNLITGAITPDAGAVDFEGRTVTAFAPHRLVSLGLVRTFQRTSVFGSMRAIDNVMLAIGARRKLGAALRLSTATRVEFRSEALGILDSVGLADSHATPAAALSHGNQRALDLAIGVALRPKVMMMDEPLAGMAQGDRERIALLILALRDQHGLGVVIVEHDIGMVMRLSDRITVLQNGKVLADGTPQAVRDDAAVKHAYLNGAFAT
ncbi:ABC transporter ATP-binding protein [soil metagenome]